MCKVLRIFIVKQVNSIQSELKNLVAFKASCCTTFKSVIIIIILKIL